MWIELRDFKSVKCDICDRVVKTAQDQYDHVSRYGVLGNQNAPAEPFQIPCITVSRQADL